MAAGAAGKEGDMKQGKWYVCRTEKGGGCGKRFASPQKLGAHVSAERSRGRTAKERRKKVFVIGCVALPTVTIPRTHP